MRINFSFIIVSFSFASADLVHAGGRVGEGEATPLLRTATVFAIIEAANIEVQ
jgi:hypothetical protein